MIQDGGDDVIARTVVIGRGRRHGNVATHGRMMTSSRRMGAAMLDNIIMHVRIALKTRLNTYLQLITGGRGVTLIKGFDSY